MGRSTAEEQLAGVIRNAYLACEKREHAILVDEAPYDNAKVAVAVVVEDGGGGSSTAEPSARDITLFALTGERPAPSHYPAGLEAQIKEEQEELVPKLFDWSTLDKKGQVQT